MAPKKRSPPKPNELADAVLRLLRKNPDGLTIDPTELAPLRAAVEQIKSGRELYQLFVAAMQLARFLETEHESPRAAATILDHLASPMAEALGRLAKGDIAADERASAARRRVAEERKRLQGTDGLQRGLEPGSARVGVGLRGAARRKKP